MDLTLEELKSMQSMNIMDLKREELANAEAEAAFFNVGTIEDAVEKAKTL